MCYNINMGIYTALVQIVYTDTSGIYQARQDYIYSVTRQTLYLNKPNLTVTFSIRAHKIKRCTNRCSYLKDKLNLTIFTYNLQSCFSVFMLLLKNCLQLMVFFPQNSFFYSHILVVLFNSIWSLACLSDSLDQQLSF